MFSINHDILIYANGPNGYTTTTSEKKEPIRNEPNQPEFCKAVRTCSAWPRKF